MSNIEPYVIVKDVEKMAQQAYGNAGKVALVGAFPCDDVRVAIYNNLADAQDALKGDYKLPSDTSVEHASIDVVPSSFTSFYCLPYIFESNNVSKGPESVLVVNVNYGADELATGIDNTSLANALTLLGDEDFDILTIADGVKLAVMNEQTAILNPMWATLKTFNNLMYGNQKPFGIITGVDIDANATVTILESFKNLFRDKGIYKAISTPIRLNGEASSLNIAQSGCWHAAFTAGRSVNKSETGKEYPNVVGEDSKTKYPVAAGVITWQSLLDNGVHTQKYRNRRLSTIQCISNITPADYDMKIERVKNYYVKKFSFIDVFGEDNNTPTRAYIEGLFEYEKNVALQNGFLTSMDYNIVSVDTDKIRANLYLGIPDIVRVVELNVTIEILAYEEAQ